MWRCALLSQRHDRLRALKVGALLAPQGLQRIDPRRTTRRKEARQQSHGDQDAGDAGEDHRVTRPGAIGLYGVMAYVLSLRTHELGVRIALGATPGSVALMITKRGLEVSAIGIAAGLLLFALLGRLLRAFLYEVAPTDPFTLIGASLTLVAISLVASWIPARRAARVSPAQALRAD